MITAQNNDDLIIIDFTSHEASSESSFAAGTYDDINPLFGDIQSDENAM